MNKDSSLPKVRCSQALRAAAEKRAESLGRSLSNYILWLVQNDIKYTIAEKLERTETDRIMTMLDMDDI